MDGQGLEIGNEKGSEAGALVGALFLKKGDIASFAQSENWLGREGGEAELGQGQAHAWFSKTGDNTSFRNLQWAGQEIEYTWKDGSEPVLFSQDNPNLIMYVQNESKFI